ncbi:MAG: hypothetical protein ACRDFW_06360 [bacterium]
MYQVSVNPGAANLFDAQSGQLCMITPELAQQIARDDFPTQGRVVQIDLVTRHDFAYP